MTKIKWDIPVEDEHPVLTTDFIRQFDPCVSGLRSFIRVTPDMCGRLVLDNHGVVRLSRIMWVDLRWLLNAMARKNADDNLSGGFLGHEIQRILEERVGDKRTKPVSVCMAAAIRAFLEEMVKP